MVSKGAYILCFSTKFTDFSKEAPMTFISKNLGIRSALRSSGVTCGRLAEIYDLILAEYDALAPALPDAMAWKVQKPAHARECGQEAREFAPILGFDDLEVAYFAIPFAAHDLGRMIEGLRKCIAPNAPEKLRVTLPAGFRERWPLIDKPSRMHGDDSAAVSSRISRPGRAASCFGNRRARPTFLYRFHDAIVSWRRFFSFLASDGNPGYPEYILDFYAFLFSCDACRRGGVVCFVVRGRVPLSYRLARTKAFRTASFHV